METAAAGVPRAVDLGRFNGAPFLYVAAFGAFTDVSYDTPQSFKNVFGHLAYVLEGATRLASLPRYRPAGGTRRRRRGGGVPLRHGEQYRLGRRIPQRGRQGGQAGRRNV